METYLNSSYILFNYISSAAHAKCTSVISPVAPYLAGISWELWDRYHIWFIKLQKSEKSRLHTSSLLFLYWKFSICNFLNILTYKKVIHVFQRYSRSGFFNHFFWSHHRVWISCQCLISSVQKKQLSSHPR